jgi:hypothetical protein
MIVRRRVNTLYVSFNASDNAYTHTHTHTHVDALDDIRQRITDGLRVSLTGKREAQIAVLLCPAHGVDVR